MNSKTHPRIAILGCLLFFSTVATAQDSSKPKPVPSNRQEMLQALNALKHREARLPLPAAEPASPTAEPAPARGAGSLGVVNNGRMRSLYLPQELSSRGGQNMPNSNNSNQPLANEFATELFWIVSRVNNCHYCLGHQESKLKSAGVTEPTLLALDTDWSSFPAKEQAAFAFTRQLTLAPHAITDQDVDKLKAHFSDAQILDIVFLIGRYNSTNRWTDSLGIPQENHREFVTALDEQAISLTSQVAPQGFPERAGIKTLANWKAELEKQSKRTPRFEIPLSSLADAQPHEALVAAIPGAGMAYVEQLKNAQIVGKLSKSLRNKIAYIAAREDQAWYMQQLSRKRLLEDGLTDEAIFNLDADHSNDQADDVALAFVKQLTVQPQSITDDHTKQLSKHFSAEEIAEIVYHTGLAAMLDRLTEVGRLGWHEA